MQFKEFVNQWLGMDMPINYSPILEIPTKMITGKIIKIEYTKNPISIILDNGYTWYLTFEQWKYLCKNNKEPKKNKMIQLEIFLNGNIKNIIY